MTVTWSETQPAGNVNKGWYSSAMSSDGSKMLAGAYTGRLYLYSDGGWSETRPGGDSNRNWYSCAMSSDGTKMLAGVSVSGRLYLGEDSVPASGTIRWTELTGGMQMLSGGMRG